MSDMPRLRPPFLVRDVSRHGQVRWYFRKDGHKTRLPDAYGSKEFMAAYDAALSGKPLPAVLKPGAASLAWLVARYQDSAAWAALSTATRRQRGNILKHIIETAGQAPFASIDRKTIVAGRERRKDTPAAARHFIDTMRGLFRWAVDAELAEADPTRDVKAPKKATDGHHTWTDEEVAQFENRHPLGSRERLAFDLLLYTGLRRSDAVTAGRQHVKGGVLTLRTAKTGEVVSIPVLPALLASIAAGPCGDLAFIVGERGRPMTKESFGNWFRRVCNAAGLSHCSAHGLRKVGATRAAEAGATVAQLEAMFGWRGGGMASLYTRKANRVKLAQSGFETLLSHPASGGTLKPKNKGKTNA